MAFQQKKWAILITLFVAFIPSTFALQENIYSGNEIIEAVFDAATSFTIPLLVYLSLNNGMSAYLFSSFIVLAIVDMGLAILFTYLCYTKYDNDMFFWIYLIVIEAINFSNYFLKLVDSKYFHKLVGGNKTAESHKHQMSQISQISQKPHEKFIKKKLIPLLLLIANFTFLGIAIKKDYVAPLNVLFILVPCGILSLVFIGFLFVNKDDSVKNKDGTKSIGFAHVRFLVEFMCTIIFVMISGPSLLWIKLYLSITIVEFSLYLERAKPEPNTKLRYQIGSVEKFRRILMNGNNDDEKGKNYILEICIREHEKIGKDDKDHTQTLSLDITEEPTIITEV